MSFVETRSPVAIHANQAFRFPMAFCFNACELEFIYASGSCYWCPRISHRYAGWQVCSYIGSDEFKLTLTVILKGKEMDEVYKYYI